MDLDRIERDLTLFLQLALRYWGQGHHTPTARGQAVKWAMQRHANLGWYTTGTVETLIRQLPATEKPDDSVFLDNLELTYNDQQLALKLRDLIYARDEALKIGRDRALIEDLIDATQLYDTAKDRQDLLDFVIRFRSIAPFNAMLLQAQRPGLTHAATARDWITRFNRRPTRTARPLVIMRTMGPVDFVFDMNETEGDPLPDAAFTFPTFGEVDYTRWQTMLGCLPRAISIKFVDDGDARAGQIARLGADNPVYEVWLNRNHSDAVQFVTLAHELAHLYLGHLGKDKRLKTADRRATGNAQQEVEAEIVAYVVARRMGVTPRSEKYLEGYLDGVVTLDKFVVLRAVNSVETALGVSANQLWKH